jgi:osmotically inducible protein OsmC
MTGIIKHASAQWQGAGKTGKGTISSESGVLANAAYGFNTRFEGAKGTNPEELIAAAHSGCFAMALAFALEKAGHTATRLDVKAAVTLEKDGDGFKVSRSALTLEAQVPGIGQDAFKEIAMGAKAGCPISKVLNAEITLDWKLI